MVYVVSKAFPEQLFLFITLVLLPLIASLLCISFNIRNSHVYNSLIVSDGQKTVATLLSYWCKCCFWFLNPQSLILCYSGSDPDLPSEVDSKIEEPTRRSRSAV